MKMSVWSLARQQSVFQHCHSENIYQSSAYKMAAKASWHRNYVTVSLCIHWLPWYRRCDRKPLQIFHLRFCLFYFLGYFLTISVIPIISTSTGLQTIDLLSDVDRRPLRSNSNDMRKLLVPRTHNKLGDRSFSAAGPRLWNDLPSGLRRPGLTFDFF